MKTPVVIIHSGSTLDDFAARIEQSINDRFHNYRLSDACERMSHGLSEGQKGEIETLSSHAAHASDGLIVNGHMASTDGGRTWTHLEKLIR